jgi:hypothetical protein
LAAIWFGLAQSICIVILMAIDRERVSFYEILVLLPFVGLASLGFSLSFLLLRPSADARRWPYVCAAAAGAATLAIWWVVVRVWSHFEFYFMHTFLIMIGSFFLAFIMTSFITGFVFLWAFKRFFERPGPR